MKAVLGSIAKVVSWVSGIALTVIVVLLLAGVRSDALESASGWILLICLASTLGMVDLVAKVPAERRPLWAAPTRWGISAQAAGQFVGGIVTVVVGVLLAGSVLAAILFFAGIGLAAMGVTTWREGRAPVPPDSE